MKQNLKELIERLNPDLCSDVITQSYYTNLGAIGMRDKRKEQADMVNHPPHYQKGGIETIDIIKMSMTKEEFLGYLKGNVIKYREKAEFKGNKEQDLKKAKWYYDLWKEESTKMNWIKGLRGEY